MQPLGGALGYILGGGAATFGSFAEFLGQENPLAKFAAMEESSGSGGGGGALGESVTYEQALAFAYFGHIDFSQFGNDNSRDPIIPWDFDKKGEELLNHWLGGSGKNLSFIYDKGWSDYMKKNGFILERLERIARSRSYFMSREGRTKTTEVSGNHHFEIDNTYNTGYGMLHGTQYFSYIMNGSYNKAIDSYVIKFNLQWTDQINHNNNVLMDKVFNSVARTFGNPADYWITIKWTQTIIIKNGEWTE